jgi:hypothetical protein
MSLLEPTYLLSLMYTVSSRHWGRSRRTASATDANSAYSASSCSEITFLEDMVALLLPLASPSAAPLEAHPCVKSTRVSTAISFRIIVPSVRRTSPLEHVGPSSN